MMMEGWVTSASSRGEGSLWEQREGMGCIVRRDNGGDGRFANRPYGGRSGCMGTRFLDSTSLRSE